MFILRCENKIRKRGSEKIYNFAPAPDFDGEDIKTERFDNLAELNMSKFQR